MVLITRSCYMQVGFTAHYSSRADLIVSIIVVAVPSSTVDSGEIRLDESVKIKSIRLQGCDECRESHAALIELAG
ncbi:hypothetical protein J1614_000366 [Plenodomus biglobosus]|nr:hypothetical protein J1614_000366 [Plenodomus biglobosus]